MDDENNKYFKEKFFKSVSDEDITYIHVSFKDKDKIKQLGGRWNSEKKSWFIFKTNKNYDELVKTYKKEKKAILKDDIVYINVPQGKFCHSKTVNFTKRELFHSTVKFKTFFCVKPL